MSTAKVSRQLQLDRLSRLLQELEDEHGPIAPQIMEEVRQAWPGPKEIVQRQ